MDSQGLCKHYLLVNTIQAIMIQIIMTINKFYNNPICKFNKTACIFIENLLNHKIYE